MRYLCWVNDLGLSISFPISNLLVFEVAHLIRLRRNADAGRINYLRELREQISQAHHPSSDVVDFLMGLIGNGPY